MKKLLFIFLIPFVLIGQVNVANAFNNLDDKTKHAIICEGITAMQGYTMYSLTDRIDIGLLAGAATALTVGGGKEIIYDKWMRRGNSSGWDFAADGFGTFKGCLQLRIEIHLEQINDKTNNYLYYNKYWFDNLGLKTLTPRDL